MRILIFFGPPGVGKGTQAALVAKNLNFAHISTGEILRNEMFKKTPLGMKIESIVKKGKLVSDELIIELIKKVLEEALKNKMIGMIFDGFPRTIKQAEMLEVLLKKEKIANPEIINLTADREELIKRLIKRGKDSGRLDDNEETIRNRLVIYDEETLPVLKFYGSQKNILDVNGVGEIEEIKNNILEEITKIKSTMRHYGL